MVSVAAFLARNSALACVHRHRLVYTTIVDTYLAPMTMRIGFFMTVLASSSTWEEKVALNKDFWIVVEEQAAKISSVWSKKPWSNSLSASSSTRCFTADKSTSFSLMAYTNLKGVVIKISIAHQCSVWTLLPTQQDGSDLPNFCLDSGVCDLSAAVAFVSTLIRSLVP